MQKINQLSEHLCQLLGIEPSAKKVSEVSDVLSDLVSEITVTHSKECNAIIRNQLNHDPQRAKRITDDIVASRETLVANLSALR